MAYLIGLANKEEIQELEKRGWEIEDAPKEFTKSQGELSEAIYEEEYIMVWVDNSLFNIMNGPDWEKGE